MSTESTLAKEIANYLQRTVIGIVRGIYRGLNKTSPDLFRKIQEPQIFLLFINQGICTYFNNCYKSLILKDDNVVLSDFATFQKYGQHSPVCLLLVFQKYLSDLLSQINFSTLSLD